MKQIRTLLYVILLLLVSCSSPDVIIVTHFPKEQTLSAKAITVPPILLLPEALFIVDNFLIALQPDKDTIFDVFQLPECTYLYSDITKGGGPNEFVVPYANFVSVGNSEFKIIDSGIFVKTARITNDSISITNRKRISDYELVNGMVEFNDGSYCILNRMTGDKEYLKINGIEKIEFSDYPELTSNKNQKENQFTTYFKYLVAPPESKDKFAAFYNKFKFIRYYDINGNLTKEIDVSIEPCHTVITNDIRDNFTYYYKPVATERYIYALCLNKTDRDLEKDFESMNMEIQVWDWNGEPVIKYILDKSFTVFTVSSDDKTLYASSFYVEDEIYVFDMIH